MLSRISHIFGLLILAGVIFSACKDSGTGSGGNNNHIDIGDSIPRLFSNYTYQVAQLDLSGNIITGTISLPNHTAFLDSLGMSLYGKSNVYRVRDDGDTCYYAYEPSSDVSIYLQSPGFMKDHSHGENIDETLQTILDVVFHRWLTLPIATKGTGHVLYDATDTLTISGDHISTKILATADFIGDSTITINSGQVLASKHCRISISAVFDPKRYSITVSHVRDIWFVPKIGYIAKLRTRTNVPYNQFLVQPADTTAIEKWLVSYQLL